MIVLYRDAPLFLHGFQHKLGNVKRNLEEMKTEKLLAGTVEALSAMGYQITILGPLARYVAENARRS